MNPEEMAWIRRRELELQTEGNNKNMARSKAVYEYAFRKEIEERPRPLTATLGELLKAKGDPR